MQHVDKITKNSFSGGRNTDVNVALLHPDQYQSAHNLDFVANGNFYGLQNIAGTTKLVEIANDATIREIGSYACKFSIDGTLTYCNLYFTMSSNTGTFNIWAYDTENVALYALYQETYAAGYYTTDRVVDVINFPENGVDHVYFADGFNELRHLTCSITTPWVANSLSAYDLALLRRGGNGAVRLSTIVTGGSLLSGTYQFAYRMCNPITKKFTKWSSITDPIHVYDADNTNAQVFAGIGLPTARAITVTVTPSDEELTIALPYLQLAVIENISSAPATTVSLQQYELFSGSPMSITYRANTRIDSVLLDSFLIDPAEIINAKTLRTTNNILFAGNINYADLEYNSSFGVPAVTAGTIIAATSATIGSTQGDSYSQDKFSSKYIGYFRDEVYRFGVVYKDKYGNRSFVSPLDMTTVVDNQISGSAKDMHFPARSVNKKYTLFNSNGYMQGLGLNLTIQNHPTWAVEMEVVRVPRKKDILFQSPLIPMMIVNGVGALGNYPTILDYVTPNGNAAQKTLSAQPMTADKTFVPKNLFWPEGRDISKSATNTTTPAILAGEVFLDNTSTSCTYSYSMVFPTPNMYGDTTTVINGITNEFIYTGAEKIDFVDQALLKLNSISFPPPDKTAFPVVSGDDVNTNVSGNFYAVQDGDYFFDSAWAAKTHPNQTYNGAAVTGYQFFDNFGITTSLNGVSVMDYESLSTKGYTYGYQPSIQRSAVVATSLTIKDPTFYGSTFSNGVLHAYNGGAFIVGSSGPHYQTNPTNDYIQQYTGWSNNLYSSAVDVVNVKLGLGDNRYGDLNDLLNYQSTGATYTFSTSEQSSLQSGGQVSVALDVWGGDCFVAPHTFKVCDSSYSVVDSGRTTGTGQDELHLNFKWRGWFRAANGGNSLMLPVALENSSQFVTVVLESEYNGGVRDHDVSPTATSLNGVPIINNAVKTTCRTPLSYRYNFNLTRQNYQKVFTTFLQFSFAQFAFDSRIAFSNVKIYNSSESGFDIFSSGDFYDLPEQRYAITSLAVAGDMLYAIQEKGVVYLPTLGRQVEETDSSTLAINSGTVIGRPVVVSTERGAQHLRGVVENGTLIYLPDNKNKDIYVLAGTDIKSITSNNQTLMRSLFTTQLAGNQVKGVYDFIRNQYLLILPSATQIFDENRSLWTGDYEATLTGGVYQRGLYFTGFDSNTNKHSIYSMYTGTNNTLLGNPVIPRVSFVVNPDEAFAKTFDVGMVDASDQLSTADLQVIYDTSSNPSFINGLNLAVPNIENNYRIPFGKDQNGYRLRGMRMLITTYWGTKTSQLKSFFTKYRYSKRTPF